MDQSQKDEILRQIKSAQWRVENRREKMIQALADLQETISAVLDNIEGIPTATGLFQFQDKIFIGESDGKAIYGDPWIVATVGWTEPDTGAPYATYDVLFRGEESAREYVSLNDVVEAISEILVEDTYKSADEEAAEKASPQPDIVAAAQAEAAAGSAPPDAAAHMEFLWEGINDKGKAVSGTIKALNRQDAIDTLRGDGIDLTKI